MDEPILTAGPNVVEPKRRRWLELFGLIATIIATAIAYLQWQPAPRRELSVERISRASLFSTDLSKSTGLKILFADKPVEKPQQFVIRISNSGTLSIDKSSIEKPLELYFEKSIVLTAQITSKNPENIEAVMSSSDHVVKIDHGLLNPKNALHISILTDGPNDWPKCSFRAVGIDDPHVIDVSGSGTASMSTSQTVMVWVVILGTLWLGIICMMWLDGLFFYHAMRFGYFRMSSDDWRKTYERIVPKDAMRAAADHMRASLSKANMSYPGPNIEKWIQSKDEIKKDLIKGGRWKVGDAGLDAEVEKFDALARKSLKEDFEDEVQSALLSKYYSSRKRIVKALGIDLTNVNDPMEYLESKIAVLEKMIRKP